MNVVERQFDACRRNDTSGRYLLDVLAASGRALVHPTKSKIAQSIRGPHFVASRLSIQFRAPSGSVPKSSAIFFGCVICCSTMMLTRPNS